MGLDIFGYAGCTTVKKAVSWAQDNGLEPNYKHFNKVADLEGAIASWVGNAGIEKVFNLKAQTFKKMSEAEQAAILRNESSMISAMAHDPRLIKRPIASDGKAVLTGFNVDEWQSTFS